MDYGHVVAAIASPHVPAVPFPPQRRRGVENDEVLSRGYDGLSVASRHKLELADVAPRHCVGGGATWEEEGIAHIVGERMGKMFLE